MEKLIEGLLVVVLNKGSGVLGDDAAIVVVFGSSDLFTIVVTDQGILFFYFEICRWEMVICRWEIGAMIEMKVENKIN